MQPTNDERTMAALAHASIVANSLSLVGLIATAVIWATQRERSAYVRGHALQALIFQGVVLVITLILALSWGLCVAFSLAPMALRPELYPDGRLPGPFWLALSGMTLPVLFGIATTIYGLFGAIQAFRVRPFSYPLLGRFAHSNALETAAVVPVADPLPDSDSQP